MERQRQSGRSFPQLRQVFSVYSASSSQQSHHYARSPKSNRIFHVITHGAKLVLCEDKVSAARPDQHMHRRLHGRQRSLEESTTGRNPTLAQRRQPLNPASTPTLPPFTRLQLPPT